MLNFLASKANADILHTDTIPTLSVYEVFAIGIN